MFKNPNAEIMDTIMKSDNFDPIEAAARLQALREERRVWNKRRFAMKYISFILLSIFLFALTQLREWVFPWDLVMALVVTPIAVFFFCAGFTMFIGTMCPEDD